MDESLLRTCYTADALINYGFYKGPVEGFYPVVMEIERATRHRSHFLSNVAIQLDGDKAEVECYGIASSTLDGDMLNVFGGRYLNEFARGHGMADVQSEYVLDHHFSAPMLSLGDAMGELQLGTGLTQRIHCSANSTQAPQIKAAWTCRERLRKPEVYLRPRLGYCSRSGIPFSR